MAGEPRDSVAMGGQLQHIVLADDPFAQMALARTNLMAGTLAGGARSRPAICRRA
jgi:hypothetical protein